MALVSCHFVYFPLYLFFLSPTITAPVLIRVTYVLRYSAVHLFLCTPPKLLHQWNFQGRCELPFQHRWRENVCEYLIIGLDRSAPNNDQKNNEIVPLLSKAQGYYQARPRHPEKHCTPPSWTKTFQNIHRPSASTHNTENKGRILKSPTFCASMYMGDIDRGPDQTQELFHKYERTSQLHSIRDEANRNDDNGRKCKWRNCEKLRDRPVVAKPIYGEHGYKNWVYENGRPYTPVDDRTWEKKIRTRETVERSNPNLWEEQRIRI